MLQTTQLSNDRMVLEAALVGLEKQKETIDEKISAVRSMLKEGTTAAPAVSSIQPKRRMSAAARAKISRAMKAKWATKRKGKK